MRQVWLTQLDFWATWFLKLKVGSDFGEEENVGGGVVELGEVVREKGEGRFEKRWLLGLAFYSATKIFDRIKDE